jgi:hypothetical protein
MSAYIRGKMEERKRMGPPPQFMLDGFQRWAQTDKPARAGGEEKEGVAPAREGGRMMDKDLKPNGGRMMDLTGGISFDDVNSFADVLPDGPGKDFIKNVTDFGRKALPVAKRFVSNLKSGPVRELVVDIVPTAREPLDKVVEFLESIGLKGSGKRKPSKKMVAMVMASPAFKEYCEKHGGALVDTMDLRKMESQTIRKADKAPPASKEEQVAKLERMVGMGKEEDEEEAIAELKQMALKGDRQAIAKLRTLEKMGMTKGEREKEDEEEAIAELKRAAMKGDRRAIAKLKMLEDRGMMKGTGIKEDIEAMNARTKKAIDELKAKSAAALKGAEPKGLAELNAKTQKGLDELNAKTKATLDAVKPTGTGKRRGLKAAMRLLRGNGVSLKEAKEVLEGGAEGKSLLDRAKAFLQSAKSKYEWLKRNKKPIHQILESADMNEDNPLGATDIPEKIAGYMSKIGLGAAQRAEQVRAAERGEEQVSASARGATTGGRKPSAYALFVKEYARKNPGLGKDLMKQAAMAWKSRK